MSELLSRVRKTDPQMKDVQLVCSTCCNVTTGEPVECESLDCPWLYERMKIRGKAEALTTIYDLLDDLEMEWNEDRRYDSNDCGIEGIEVDADDDSEAFSGSDISGADSESFWSDGV